METLFGLLIAFLIACWVYSDATDRGSSSPVGWAAGVFLLLIVFLPLYFIFRPAKQVVVNTPVVINTSSVGNPQLCKSCGKYFDGNPDFCPNCGTSLKNSSIV